MEETRAARATGPRNEIDISRTLKREYLDPSPKPQASRRRATASDRIDPVLGYRATGPRRCSGAASYGHSVRGIIHVETVCQWPSLNFR